MTLQTFLQGDDWDKTYLLRTLAHFHFKLSKGQNSQNYIGGCCDGRSVSLTRVEVRHAHLANHVSDGERLHICILKGNESASMANDAEKVNKVVLFADLVSFLDVEELEDLRHGFDLGGCKALENCSLFVEDFKDAFRLVCIQVCYESHDLLFVSIILNNQI